MLCTLFATILLFFGSHRCDAVVGANSTISNLTAKTNLAGDDTMVIVDNSVVPATTKKITFANATSSFKTYNDLIYSPIAGGTGIVTVGTITAGTWSGTNIAVAKGGTGTTTFALNHVLLGDTTSGMKTVNGQGTSGYLLTSNGAGSAPSWQNVAIALNTDNTWTGANTFNATTTNYGFNLNNGNFATTTAGGTINGTTLPVPVSLATTTSRVIAMDGNDITTMDNFVGFAVQNGTNGTEIVVQTDGIVKGFSGLTVGKRYYVQDAVGTIGTTMGTFDFYVGIAASATTLLIDRSEGGNQYIGSVAFVETAADSTTCTATATVSPLSRFHIAKMATQNSAAGDETQATVPVTRSSTGLESGITATASITTSMSGSVITMSGTYASGGGNGTCSGTVYMYR